MIWRVAYQIVLGLISSGFLLGLLYVDAGGDEAVLFLGPLSVSSVVVGALLFVALTFFARSESLLAAIVFTVLATVILPPLLTIAHFLPTYGVVGALACLPPFSFASMAMVLFELAISLTIVVIFYYIIRELIGP